MVASLHSHKSKRMHQPQGNVTLPSFRQHLTRGIVSRFPEPQGLGEIECDKTFLTFRPKFIVSYFGKQFRRDVITLDGREAERSSHPALLEVS